MTKDAEQHAKEDEEAKAKIEAKNQADSLIFTSEKTLKEAGDKVDEALKKEVEEKISALREILDTGSKEDLEAKTGELSESIQKVGQAMSSAGQNPEQPKEGEAGSEEAKTDGEEKKEEDSKDDKKKKDGEDPVEGEVVD